MVNFLATAVVARNVKVIHVTQKEEFGIEIILLISCCLQKRLCIVHVCNPLATCLGLVAVRSQSQTLD